MFSSVGPVGQTARRWECNRGARLHPVRHQLPALGACAAATPGALARLGLQLGACAPALPALGACAPALPALGACAPALPALGACAPPPPGAFALACLAMTLLLLTLFHLGLLGLLGLLSLLSHPVLVPDMRLCEADVRSSNRLCHSCRADAKYTRAQKTRTKMRTILRAPSARRRQDGHDRCRHNDRPG